MRIRTEVGEYELNMAQINHDALKAYTDGDLDRVLRVELRPVKRKPIDPAYVCLGSRHDIRTFVSMMDGRKATETIFTPGAMLGGRRLGLDRLIVFDSWLGVMRTNPKLNAWAAQELVCRYSDSSAARAKIGLVETSEHVAALAAHHHGEAR